MQTPTNERRLGDMLARHYPGTHNYATDKALWQYTQDLKNQFLRDAPSINKVIYGDKIHVLKNALGSYTVISHVQNDKLRAKAEIHVVTMFRNASEPFLRMVVAYELVHLEEREHNRAFYQLCCHMEPQYHQLESDTRLRLAQLSLGQDKA